MSDETTIMDWGSDMAGCIAYIKTHPCPAKLRAEAIARGEIEPDTRRRDKDDKGRTMDRMFDRTRYEQASHDSYQRLLDQGHRA